MFAEYIPTNSEVLVIIGAGATAALGMPQTNSQTNIFRDLCEEEKPKEEILKDYFSEADLIKVLSLLELLDGSENYFFGISDKDLENAKIIYGKQDEKLLRNRILELRTEYDWNAAKKVLRICPHVTQNDNLIRDAYSIIDKKLLAHQSIKVQSKQHALFRQDTQAYNLPNNSQHLHGKGTVLE